MSKSIEHAAVKIIEYVYSDLAAAIAECGEELDAESLADTVGDHLHDSNEEYRNMPYPLRRAIVLQICNQYV